MIKAVIAFISSPGGLKLHRLGRWDRVFGEWRRIGHGYHGYHQTSWWISRQLPWRRRWCYCATGWGRKIDTDGTKFERRGGVHIFQLQEVIIDVYFPPWPNSRWRRRSNWSLRTRACWPSWSTSSAGSCDATSSLRASSPPPKSSISKSPSWCDCKAPKWRTPKPSSPPPTWEFSRATTSTKPPRWPLDYPTSSRWRRWGDFVVIFIVCYCCCSWYHCYRRCCCNCHCLCYWCDCWCFFVVLIVSPIKIYHSWWN